MAQNIFLKLLNNPFAGLYKKPLLKAGGSYLLEFGKELSSHGLQSKLPLKGLSGENYGRVLYT
jgi:hypothetical protein